LHNKNKCPFGHTVLTFTYLKVRRCHSKVRAATALEGYDFCRQEAERKDQVIPWMDMIPLKTQDAKSHTTVIMTK